MKTKINPLMLLALAAQAISIYYSFTFFNDINTFFGVLIVLFEITLFIFSPRIKEAKNIVIKGVMILVVILVASFSILGVLANGYNFILESNSKQYKTIVSDEYLKYKSILKDLQTDKTELQSQLIKYPSLESTISSLKPWENKKETINNWNTGYQKLTDEITKSKEKIAGLKGPAKTKIVRKNIKGYNSIFKLTGLKEETCIFWLTFIIAIMLQFIILSARLFKTKSEISDLLKSEKSEKSEISDRVIIEENIIKNETLETSDNYKSENKIKSEISDYAQIQVNNNVESLDTSDNNKSEISDYEKISDYLRLNYKSNDKIKKFQSEFNLSLSDYRKIMKQLKDENIIYTKDRNTYMQEVKLKIVK